MTYNLDQIKALRAENDRFRDQLVITRGEFEQLKSEVLEQARLNGMGSEREAKLLGEVERLNRMLDKWMAEHEPAVLRMGMEIERLKEALSEEKAARGFVVVDRDYYKLRAQAAEDVAIRLKQDRDIRFKDETLIVPIWVYTQGSVKDLIDKRIAELKGKSSFTYNEDTGESWEKK